VEDQVTGGAQGILTGALYFTVGSGLVLAVAAVGELVQERAGVLNLGLEGVFLAGALGGFYSAYRLHEVWLGYVGGAVTAALVGVFFALLVVRMKLNQVVAGILLVSLSLAAADTAWKAVVQESPAPPHVAPAPRQAIPLLAKIPVVGPGLFDRIVPEYLVFVLVAAVAWLLFRTRIGLLIRSVGESPDAVHFSGHSVAAIRFLAVVIGCALAGLAGALLTVGQLGFYAPGVTAGDGWIALAIVIMGGWRPVGVLIGAIVFGAAEMLQLEVQASQIHLVPFEFLVAFPYVVVVISLLIRRRSVRAPSALGVPYHEPE
jgi:ABC-type uncharacterized transport system permease subunit